MSYFLDPVLDDDDGLFSDEPSAPPPIMNGARTNSDATYELAILEQILQAQQVAASILNEQPSNGHQHPYMHMNGSHPIYGATPHSSLGNVAISTASASNTMLPGQAYYMSQVEQELMRANSIFSNHAAQLSNASIASATHYPSSFVDYRNGAYSPMSNASSTAASFVHSNPASPTFPPFHSEVDLTRFPEISETQAVGQGPLLVLPTSARTVGRQNRPRRLTDSDYWRAMATKEASKSVDSLALSLQQSGGGAVRKHVHGNTLMAMPARPRSHSASSLNQPVLLPAPTKSKDTSPQPNGTASAKKLKRRASSILPDYSKNLPTRTLSSKERAAFKRSSQTNLRTMPSISSSMNSLFIAPHVMSPLQAARAIDMNSPSRATFLPEMAMYHHPPSLAYSGTMESDMDAQMGFISAPIDNPTMMSYTTQPDMHTMQAKIPIANTHRHKPIDALDDLSTVDFDDITVTHLKKLLKQRGRETRGKKSELIARLKEEMDVLKQAPAPSPYSMEPPTDGNLDLWLDMLNQAIYDGKLGTVTNHP